MSDGTWRGLRPDETTALTAALIRAESPDPPGDETRVAATLDRELRRLGFAVETEEFAPGRFNVLARVRGRGERPALVFSAHTDTLPAGNGAWTSPPFAGEVRDGRIWGRGACDMKSGIAAMVSAAVAIARADTPLAGDLVLAFTGGESSSCLGARRLVETRALEGAGWILVSEPSSLDVITTEKCAFWLRATATGVAGHLSGSGEAGKGGRSAIVAMLEFLRRLPEVVPAGEHPLLGGATVNIGTISGGTAINLVPDLCVAGIDFRLLPAHDPDTVEAAVRALAGATIAIERIDLKPAVETPLDDPFVAACLAETAAHRGVAVAPRGVAYFSDACVLSPAFDLPMVIIGPGDFGGSGALDESCSVAALHDAAVIYERIARRMLG